VLFVSWLCLRAQSVLQRDDSRVVSGSTSHENDTILIGKRALVGALVYLYV
jgi:hypothetical protein